MRQDLEPPIPGKRPEAIASLRSGGPSFDIREIDNSAVPAAAQKRLNEVMRWRFDDHICKTRTFLITGKDRFDNPIETYVVSDVNTMPSGERVKNYMYTIDMIGDNLAGHSTMRYGPGVFPDKGGEYPIVSATFTEGEEGDPINFRDRGLYALRLQKMNALAESHFGLPLHSGIDPRLDATRVWEYLEREGQVARLPTKEGEKPEFVFKSQQDRIER